jgi:hypothetical protein
MCTPKRVIIPCRRAGEADHRRSLFPRFVKKRLKRGPPRDQAAQLQRRAIYLVQQACFALQRDLGVV